MENGGMVGLGQKISNWEKPGGTLGMVMAAVLGVGGVFALYKALPFLITLASNIVTLLMLLGVIGLILFLVTDKKVRMMVSAGYFIAMRQITGAFIEIDPIAIVERRVMQMIKKIAQISKTMGDVKGLIKLNEQKLAENQAKFEKELLRSKVFKEQENKAGEQVSNNQCVRLSEVIKTQKQRLEDSKKWYEVLKKLEEMANLTVEDTQNAVAIRKDEFESIKQQHKAFKSVMSIMKGDPDEMAMFTQAMDLMANDINAKLGEMEHVLNSTGGLLAQYSVDNGVSSKKADELLEKYDKLGINGMFESFNATPVKAEEVKQTISMKSVPTIDGVTYEIDRKNSGNKYF